MKKLQVIAIAPVATKDYPNNPLPDGSTVRSYKMVTYATPLQYVDEDGEIVIRTAIKQSVQSVFNFNFLDNKPNHLFSVLKVGDKVAGDIVTVDTDAYTIPERRNGQLTGNLVTLTKDTFMVLADSSNQEEWDAAVERTRKQRADQRLKSAISTASLPGASV